MAMANWHVLETKPHREAAVSQFFANVGIRTFNPLYRESYYRSHTILTKVVPLFPNYLFVDTDLDDARNFHNIRYTRGVKKVLCAGSLPIRISEDVIETIKSFQSHEGVIDNLGLLKCGDKVKVKKGLLKDLVGVLQNQVDAMGRVKVLFDLANMQLKAKMHWTEIEKISQNCIALR